MANLEAQGEPAPSAADRTAASSTPIPARSALQFAEGTKSTGLATGHGMVLHREASLPSVPARSRRLSMGFGAGLALPRSLTSASRKTGSVSLEPSAWSTLESEIGSLRGFAEIPIRYRSLSIHVADEPPETELDYETAHHLREVDYHRISVAKVFQVYGTDPDLGLDTRAVERANDANKTKRANVITPAKTNYLKKFARYIFGKPMHACDFCDPRLPAGFDFALFQVASTSSCGLRSS